MKKRTGILALALFLALGGNAVQAQEQTEFKVQVEGQQILFDASPFLQDGRVFVPLRALSEALGADVQYDPLEDVTTIVKGDVRLVLNFRSGEVTRNGQPFPMKPGPRFVDDRAMVPLRFLGEALNEQVHYEETTQTITLTPTPETLSERQAIRALWLDSLAKTSQQSGFRIDIDSRSVKDKQIEEAHTTWEYQREPFVLHGEQKELPQYQWYINRDKMWSFDPRSDGWSQSFIGTELQRSSLQLAGLVPLTQSEVDQLLPFAMLQEQETTRVLTVRPSRYAFMKWILSSFNIKQEPSPQELYVEGAKYQNVSLIFTIDKSTGLLNEFQTKMIIGEADQERQVRYYDYGQVPAIAKPDSIKE